MPNPNDWGRYFQATPLAGCDRTADMSSQTGFYRPLSTDRSLLAQRFYVPVSLAHQLIEDNAPDTWRSFSTQDRAAYQDMIETFVIRSDVLPVEHWSLPKTREDSMGRDNAQ